MYVYSSSFYQENPHEHCVSDNDLSLDGVGINFLENIIYDAKIGPVINIRFKQAFLNLKLCIKIPQEL